MLKTIGNILSWPFKAMSNAFTFSAWLFIIAATIRLALNHGGWEIDFFSAVIAFVLSAHFELKESILEELKKLNSK